MEPKLKVTSFAGLCEELWRKREDILNLLIHEGRIDDDTNGRDWFFAGPGASPLDLGWYVVGMNHLTCRGMLSPMLGDYGLGRTDGGAAERVWYMEDLRRVEERFWKAREDIRGRLYEMSGKRTIPVDIRYWLDNQGLRDKFIRVSEENEEMWVYTPSVEYGLGDRQIRARPGRVIKKLLEHLDDALVQKVATAYTQGTKLYAVEFARTSKDIVDVYVRGPSSCMSKPASFFNEDYDDNGRPGCEGHHPAEAYESPDLAVAYIRNFEGEITARAVVNERDKQFGRLYGNELGLKNALAALGYVEQEWCEALMGCRLKRILLSEGDYLCPYIDGISNCLDNGEWLVLGRGHLDCQKPGGRIYTHSYYEGEDDDDDDDDRPTCAHCGDHTHQGDLNYIENYGDVCEHCCDNSHTFVYGIIDAHGGTGYMRYRDTTYIDCLQDNVLDSLLENDAAADRLGIVYSPHDGEWLLTKDAVEVEGYGWVDPDAHDLVKDIQGDWRFREDCTLLHNDEWAHNDEDLYELSSYSSAAGKMAIEGDCRPALGAENVLDFPVLVRDVINYQGLEFYLGDCVLAEFADYLKYIPRIAAKWDEERKSYVEAADLPWQDEMHLVVAPPAVETATQTETETEEEPA